MKQILIIIGLIVSVISGFKAGKLASPDIEATPQTFSRSPDSSDDENLPGPDIDSDETASPKTRFYQTASTLTDLRRIIRDLDLSLEDIGELMSDRTSHADNAFLFALLASKDPILAWSALEVTPNGQDRELLRVFLLESMGRNDGEAAIHFLEENGKLVRKYHLNAILEGWAISDLNGAMAYVLKDNGHRIDLEAAASIFGEQLSNAGGAEALDKWLNDSKDERTYHLTVAAVAKEYAKLGYETSIDWFQTIKESNYAGIAANEIARTWSRIDPESTLNWISQLESEKIRQSSYKVAVNSWAEMDYKAVSDWMYSLPIDDEFDPIVESYSRLVAEKDPLLALSWISTLAEGSTKQRLYYEVASAGYGTDPKVVDAIMNSEGVSEQVRSLFNRFKYNQN